MTNIMESNTPPVGDEIDQSQSSQQGGSVSSPGGVELKTVFEQLNALTAQIRGLQAAADKNSAASNRKIAQLTKQFTEVKGYLDKYPSVEEAARQRAFDELIGEVPQEETPLYPATTPQVSGRQPVQPGINSELLALLGVPESDPQFVAEMAGGKSALEAAVAVAKANRQASAPNPAAIQPTGAAPAATTQKAALQDAYDKEIKSIRRGDWAGIAALNEKYRKKGLDIW